MPKKKKPRTTNAMQTNGSNNNSYLYWLLGAFASGLFLAVVYTLLRNQSNIALSNQNIAPADSPIPTLFFPTVIEHKNTWLDSVKFSLDDSISNTKDQELVHHYIKLQKTILDSISLSPANELALSKTTIHWVPVAPSFIDTPKNGIISGFVSQPQQINIVLRTGLTKEELRFTLLNEIHHVTVFNINRHKIKAKTRLEICPFLTQEGKIDVTLSQKLQMSINELHQNVMEFSKLFNNKQRNDSEDKKFNTYLESIIDYRPNVHRIDKHTNGRASDSKIVGVTVQGEKTILYRHDRPIVYEKKGKIQILCSANKDNSSLELARAFLFDYKRSYKDIEALRGNHYSYLVEASSNIDMLFTDKMKKVFARSFKDYFDNYAESYLADQVNSHSAHSPLSMRAGR